jgi:hypothetical protein
MAYTLREVTVRPRVHDFVVFVRDHRSAKTAPAAAAHRLFRITLPDGSHYAVDFTSAQFSQLPARIHFHGIIPWDYYLTHLQLVDADMTVAHGPPDQRFMPRTGPHSIKETRKRVCNLLRPQWLSIVKLRKMTALVTRFSLLLSIQNTLIQGFHWQENPKLYLTEILTSTKARCAEYARRIPRGLRYCLLAWRLVLRFGHVGTWDEGNETSADFLQFMWNFLVVAERELLKPAAESGPRRRRASIDNKVVDTPQQSA